jgi:hypothetical protein
MREPRKSDMTLELCFGSIIAVIGIALIGFAGWKAFDFWTSTTLYVAGFLACLGGFVPLWKDLPDASVVAHESMVGSENNFLGRFRLNGCSFEAYEREGANGSKQFRLVSSPKISPEREGARIRYMVNEGLIENLWPEMSNKIKEEADWAFLP